MVLETLDRTQWSFAEARAHVEGVVVAHRAVAASRLPAAPLREYMPWERPQDPQAKWKEEAREQLLVALRDGDLHAQGRYTEERPHAWGGAGSGFGLHSGHHSSIRPEQWREARYLNDKLTATLWEFIDIRMPRFMVLAIWPAYVPPSMPKLGDAPAYTTPYLALMQEAIAQFGMSEDRQEKKDSLFEWFLTQEVDGEPISKNLADAMGEFHREAQHRGRITYPSVSKRRTVLPCQDTATSRPRREIGLRI